eukprot:6209947-Pleurochrysis_carterae.AAC.1
MAAAHEALDKGLTKYTAMPGTHELRSAICSYLEREKGVSYTPDQVGASAPILSASSCLFLHDFSFGSCSQTLSVHRDFAEMFVHCVDWYPNMMRRPNPVREFYALAMR